MKIKREYFGNIFIIFVSKIIGKNIMMMKELKPLDRKAMFAEIDSGKEFDIVIIGGGASGLGVAVDAASQGYSVCLVDAQDFAAGTSSRSTKLIHGGVRYM